jgi:hypothetical protein
MLMVVFGAGASYDSAPSYPPNRQHFFEDQDRMPLANELFDNRSEFVRALNYFPSASLLSLICETSGTGSLSSRDRQWMGARGVR